MRAVEAAVLELDRQQSQVRLSGRALLIDVVVDAPPRFSDAVRAATEDEQYANEGAARNMATYCWLPTPLTSSTSPLPR